MSEPEPVSETAECGCVTTRSPGRRWRKLVPCRPHKVRMLAFDALHEWGGHEDCCDIPGITRAMAQHGITTEELATAAATVTREPERAYVRRLLVELARVEDQTPPPGS